MASAEFPFDSPAVTSLRAGFASNVSTFASSFLLANVRVIVDPVASSAATRAAAGQQADVKTRPATVSAAGTGNSPAKASDGGSAAKCFDALLDFSLGDVDGTARDRLRGQKCQ